MFWTSQWRYFTCRYAGHFPARADQNLHAADISIFQEGGGNNTTRKKFFTVEGMRHWNRFPNEVMDASSLEAFKAGLDGALGNLV